MNSRTLQNYNLAVEEYGEVGELEWLTLPEQAEADLRAAGVVFGDAYMDASPEARLIMLCEAVNWAAKTINYEFYELKNPLLTYAVESGITSWSLLDERCDEVLYLYHPECGTASFHNPGGWEVGELQGPRYQLKQWPWSGVPRQEDAFKILTSKETLAWYAKATRPRMLPVTCH